MSASSCAWATPAVILFQLFSSVIASGRITFASALGFRGRKPSRSSEVGLKTWNADGFWRLDGA
jgi:hypothetical protein